MELKMQTSLLLIIGTITALAGWMFIYPGDGDGSSGAADNAAAPVSYTHLTLPTIYSV